MDGPEYAWVSLLPVSRFTQHRQRSIVSVSSDSEPRPYEIYVLQPAKDGPVYAIQQSCPHAGVPLDYSDLEDLGTGDWRGLLRRGVRLGRS
jgi:nitrite reductase/ring-hydroxylating ferredoxin subunit